MKVLIVADVVGGVRTFVRELARALLRREIEVHMALIGPGEIEVPGASSCEIRNLRLEWMDGAWDDVAATAKWIEERRRAVQPDLIHMNTFTPVHDPEVPALLTVHSCVLTWWRSVHGITAPNGWARYGALVRRALGRADLVAVPTRALLDDLTAIYGDLREARVIPNGRAIPAPARGRRERLVVSAGRLWDEAKNAQLLASAAPAIHGRVALLGPGRIAGIECLGQLPEHDVLSWMSRAAVFAEPARYEPFGLAALEAALSGCAIVLGDIPSLREVWGDAATFVSPEDPAALAAAVNALLDDPARRARAAQAARTHAARFTVAAMARDYRSAYKAITRTAVPA